MSNKQAHSHRHSLLWPADGAVPAGVVGPSSQVPESMLPLDRCHGLGGCRSVTPGPLPLIKVAQGNSRPAPGKLCVPARVPVCVCVCLTMCTCMLNFVPLLVTPWTVAHQSPLSMGFPRQEHWNGLPFPPPAVPDPGMEPMILACPALTGGSFTTALLLTLGIS